jgi:endo-1,4-beta-xylanase
LKNLFILFIAAIALCNAHCTKKDSSITIPQSDTTPLQNVSPFKVGASVVVPLLQNNSLYRNTAEQQYNTITPANTLKWYIVHPSENIFDFSGGDYVWDFCSATGKRMHGHCLIWYHDNPAWLNNFQGDSLEW